MSAVVLRGDAAHLPLPDASVDLIVTSPPYWGLRSYTDGGEHYEGQIGSEETPQQWLEAMWRCTAEWMRVLKPAGSIFVNCGDKYAAGHGGRSTEGDGDNIRVRRTRPAAEHWAGVDSHPSRSTAVIVPGFRPKTLMMLPQRYAIGCMDRLGLILRAEIIWDKVNGLPESVTDRVRRAHEQIWHFTKQPRYFSAVDEIREPVWGDEHSLSRRDRTDRRLAAADGGQTSAANPLGKLPGSVWEIPSAPLVVPAHLGIDHFAAYPPELCRRIILGWSPPGICTACGEGRRPVTTAEFDTQGRTTNGPQSTRRRFESPGRDVRAVRQTTITGYTCACSQPDTPERHPDCPRCAADWINDLDAGQFPVRTDQSEAFEQEDALCAAASIPHNHPPAEPSARILPPTRPAVVLDPFAGTGTTMLTASVLGRIGIGVDRSADYCRLATWRCSDPGERARALGVPKPPPVPEGQASLFDLEAS